MDNFLNLAHSRRSIRKYEDKEIPEEDIEYFVKVAVGAPSGCNSQCWKFIAIRDREVIKKIEEAVICKVDQLLEIKKQELTENYWNAKRKMVSFFSKAPVVIAVFMTRLDFYDPTFVSALEAQGYNGREIMELFANPDLLSVGAAIQNLLLAVHEKGYGACWMNEPAVAGKEINQILKVPEEHRFISLIPIGVPAYTPKEKKMKDFDEVFSII